MPAPSDLLVPARGTNRCLAPARSGERGATWVTLLLLLGLACTVYLGWVWVPVYADHYAARQATRDFMNQAVKNRDDAALVAGLSAALARIGRASARDEEGNAYDVPAVDVPPEAISWERDTESSPPMLRVFFEYERPVYFPLVRRTVLKHLSVALENDITVPQWN